MAPLVCVYAFLAVAFAAPGSRVVLATRAGSAHWLLGLFEPASLDGLARGPLAGPVFYAGLWICLLCYAGLVLRSRDLPARLVLALIAGLHLLFFLAPPLLSQDVFSYIAYARIGAEHGLSPYTTPPLAIAHDPAAMFAGSKWAPSVYGPAFTLATYPLAPLRLATSFWILKAVAALASLAIVAVVYLLCKRLGCDPKRGALIVGANPIVLVHVVAGAHNEALVVLCVCVSLLLLARARPLASGGLGAVGAAMKASAALVLCFVALAAVRGDAPTWISSSRRAGFQTVGRLVAGAAMVALACVALAVLFFGNRWLDAFAALGANQAITSHLSIPAATATALGAIFSHSPAGLHPATRLIAGCVFVATFSLCLWRTWRGADPIGMAGWTTLCLLLATAWLVPWYMLWLLPLVAVSQSKRLFWASLALSGWCLAIAIPF